MARVTVEDCVQKVPNRFELVLLAAQRARNLSRGEELTVDRDNDKDPVVALREIADEKGVTASQLALAWVMARSDRDSAPTIVPIPGTKRVKYLEENAAAAEVRLGDDDLRRLDEAAPVGAAAGDRYPDMSSVHV